MRTRPWKESEYESILMSRPFSSEARTPVADLQARSFVRSPERRQRVFFQRLYVLARQNRAGSC